LIANRRTPEGAELGQQIARLCDIELAGKEDSRCATCAGRGGEHLANGSPETLMTFVKCVAEREPFWCHEHDRPCAAWSALRFPAGEEVEVPWPAIEAGDYQAGDVIPLPDQSSPIHVGLDYGLGPVADGARPDERWASKAPTLFAQVFPTHPLRLT